MGDFQATTIVIALFLLRCIVPIVFVLVVGYFMNRLADRWRAADELMMAEKQEETVQPAKTGQTGASLPVITIPCWILRNCEPEAYTDCPAYQKPGLPCWMVKSSKDGLLPAGCPDCPIYGQSMAPALA